MSKLFKRKGFRLASVAYFLSLGTLAVSLFAWFSTSSTFSWFASNKETNASGMAIKVKSDDDVDIEMDVFKYVEKGSYDSSSSWVGKNEYHVQQFNDSDTDWNRKIAMNRYDTVFQEDNKYTPILFRLKLSGGNHSKGTTIPLKITHDTDKDKLITTSKDSEGTAATCAAFPLSSYISSVVSVKAVVYDGTNSSDSTSWDTASYSSETCPEPTAIFEYMRTVFNGGVSSLTPETQYFVTSMTGGEDKDGAKTAALKTETISFADLKFPSTGDCTLYIWIDYDTEKDLTGYPKNGSSTENWGTGLINAYINQMEDYKSAPSINVSYPILCDLTEISVVSDSQTSSQSA